MWSCQGLLLTLTFLFDAGSGANGWFLKVRGHPRRSQIPMANMIRPAPVELCHKNMRFLITHNPTDSTLTSFIEVCVRAGDTKSALTSCGHTLNQLSIWGRVWVDASKEKGLLHHNVEQYINNIEQHQCFNLFFFLWQIALQLLWSGEQTEWMN